MSVVTDSLCDDNFFVNVISKIHNLKNSLIDHNIFSFTLNDIQFNYKQYSNFKLSVVYWKFNYCNTVNENFNFFILDDKNNLLFSMFNIKKYDNDAINELKLLVEKDWKYIEVTKLKLNFKNIYLFNFKNIWYVTDSNIIKQFFDIHENNIFSTIPSYFNDLSINLNNCNKNNVYHLSIKNNLEKNNSIVSLVHIFNNSNNDNINNDDILLKLNKEKIIHFSCLDEMLMATELMNNEDIVTKNIQYGGYLIKIFDKQFKNFTLFCIRTEIYKYISSILPKYDNQYKSFLELYQNDHLTDVLPYLHKYPADVIRRINMSVKVLSKEILNIYHLTRKKQNKELYNILPISYKKILYDLHKVYVNQKFSEINNKDYEILKERKSISVDIVYSHLKNIKNVELVNVFNDRKTLLEKIQLLQIKYNEIMSIDNIDIITQTELMFPS